jgi:5'-3' exonuclease
MISKVLIDGDILVYRAAFAAEHTKCTLTLGTGEVLVFKGKRALNAWIKENLPNDEYDVEFERVIEPLSHALQNVKSIMRTILDGANVSDYIVYLTASDSRTFRDELATIAKYKGNRDNAPRPKWYHEVRDYIMRHLNTEVCEGIEADDALAMAQTKDTVIVSVDKDLLQIPGLHFNWVKDEKYNVSPETGRRNLYEQVLKGDRTDNIMGIPGVGDVRAKKMLAECVTEEDMWVLCLDAWRDYFVKSDNKDERFKFDEETGVVTYTSWKDEEINRTIEEFVTENLSLLRVGERR